MKITTSLARHLAALIASAFTATMVSGAPVTYTSGDLFLAFRATGNPGATQDYLVNIGPASSFTSATSVTKLTNIGNISLDLANNIFGPNWHSRADVLWSVSGTPGSTSAGGDPANTLYATVPEATAGTLASPHIRSNSAAQSAPTNKLTSLASAFLQTAGSPNESTANSSVARIQNTTDINSYAFFQSPSSNYGYFSATIEGNFENGTEGSILDLYRLIPSNDPFDPVSSGTPGQLVGRFTINDQAEVTFTPAAKIGVADVQLKLATSSTAEDAGTATVTLVRGGDPVPSFDVTLNTTDGSALDGTDYTAQSNVTVRFDVNQTEATVAIPVTNRPGTQGARSFNVVLSTPTNGITLGSQSTSAVSITDQLVPGTLEIAVPWIDVNESDGVVQIPIIRTGGADGAVSFTVTALNGTATVNSDFLSPSPTQTLGNGVTTLNVPINLITPGTNEPNETFTVTISNATGGASIGTQDSITVRIIDTIDPTAPTAPVITTPVAGSIGVNTGASINVTGSATDNKGISLVKVKLNTGSFVNAVTTPSGTKANYTLPITPITGTNTITVQSFDTLGAASPPVTRTFIVTRPLTIAVTTTGTASGTLTAGFLNTNYKEVGKSYTVVVTPATTTVPGAIFVGWAITSPHLPQDIGVASAALAKQSLTFIFREGLTLEARFADNPYNDAAGVYNGLVHASAVEPNRPGPDDGTLPSNATEGFFNATVQKTGAFSGKITIDGLTLNVAGTFDELGHARFGTARTLTTTVARTNKPSLVVNFDLPSFTAPHVVTGKVVQTDFRKSSLPTGVSNVSADKAYYTGVGAFVVPDRYLTVSGTNKTDGVYTTVLPPLAPAAQPAALQDPRDYPQGNGYGTIKISKNGTVAFTAALADGTTATASTTLSQAIGLNEIATFPLFVQLYNKLGFLSGTVTLNNSLPESDLTAINDLLWSRPFQATQQWYPYGWPEVLTVGLDAARYVNTGGALKKANRVNLTGPDLVNGNADLAFSEGLLSENIIKPISYDPTTNAIVKVPDNDPTYTISVAPATGVISGTFVNEDDTKPAYGSIIYQKGANAGAYGFFLTTKPTVIDYTGESGAVTVRAR